MANENVRIHFKGTPEKSTVKEVWEFFSGTTAVYVSIQEHVYILLGYDVNGLHHNNLLLVDVRTGAKLTLEPDTRCSHVKLCIEVDKYDY